MFNEFQRLTTFDERKRLQCNECKRATIHTLEARCVGSWNVDSDDGPLSGATEFSLFRCGACDTVCFERSTWESEIWEVDNEGNTFHPRRTEQYPPPSSADFTFNTENIPLGLESIINEMLYAIAGGALNLATVGIRMAIEFIVNDKKCKGVNLSKKIDDLLTKNLIDQSQCDLLHKIRVKGNKGAHQALGMTNTELVAAIGIVDLLMENFYNAPARQADAIRKANRAFK